MNYVELHNVIKTYKMGDVPYNALDGINLSIKEGEFALILGPSGAGKTTMLNILGCIDRCDKGKVIVNSVDVSKCNQNQLTEFRRKNIGFVFQHYNLIQNLTALENVQMASEISDHPFSAKTCLKLVNLSERCNHFPSQLSGGEQQRVAIARALVKNPSLLLCDEPTGALDTKTGKSILALLQRICIELRVTVVVITHNPAMIPVANRIISMKNGSVEKIGINESPKLVKEIEW